MRELRAREPPDPRTVRLLLLLLVMLLPLTRRLQHHALNMLRSLSLFALVAATAAASQGPCDILLAAGNDCVAAHSTARALYAAYDGPLYTVQKNNTQEQMAIGPVKAGGFADKAKHDKCALMLRAAARRSCSCSCSCCCCCCCCC